jgi:hypothetical protein
VYVEAMDTYPSTSGGTPSRPIVWRSVPWAAGVRKTLVSRLTGVSWGGRALVNLRATGTTKVGALATVANVLTTSIVG